MDFRPTPEQAGFAAALTDLMRAADSVTVARAWAAGDTAPGSALWRRLADQGITALVVPEDEGGLGGSLTDLCIAFEVLGHELAVGPWIESAALAPQVDGDMVTAAVPLVTPYALDADVARLLDGAAGAARASVDTTRHLFEVEGADPTAFDAEALDRAALACAAQLLGCGERLLADTVGYVQQRSQYGRTIGSYQAVKHQLADVRIALDFARPLVFGAALGATPVSAAKVAAADAAYLASRTALQLHGAIGYTAEFALSLWINRVRALVGAWGTPSHHRERLAAQLLGAAR
jgi:alkylation response protein AidB-like acyl-CoA dehydrogenase